MKFPIAHIRKLRRIVLKYDLPRPPEFDQATDEQLQEIYNGIGSDKFSALLGGDMSIASQPGIGSMVTLRLPLRQRDADS